MGMQQAGEVEFTLPGVRPDLAFWRGDTRLELGEIKPDNAQGIADGEAKLARALPAGRARHPDRIVSPLGVPLDIGLLGFPTLSITPGCQTQRIFVKPPQGGVYLYHCEPSFKELKQRGCQCAEPPPPVRVPDESEVFVS